MPGLLVRRRDTDGKWWTQMGSMTLVPTKFPMSAYNQALEIQEIYNELYQKIAQDHDFLEEVLKR